MPPVERYVQGQSPIIDNQPNLMPTRNINMFDGAFQGQKQLGRALTQVGDMSANVALQLKETQDKGSFAELQMMKMEREAEIMNELETGKLMDKPTEWKNYYNTEIQKLEKNSKYTEKLNSLSKNYRQQYEEANNFDKLKTVLSIDNKAAHRIVEKSNNALELQNKKYFDMNAPYHYIVQNIDNMQIPAEQKELRKYEYGQMYASRYYTDKISAFTNDENTSIADLEMLTSTLFPDVNNPEEYEAYMNLITETGYPVKYTETGEPVYVELSKEARNNFKQDIQSEIEYKRRNAKKAAVMAYSATITGQIPEEFDPQRDMSVDVFNEYQRLLADVPVTDPQDISSLLLKEEVARAKQAEQEKMAVAKGSAEEQAREYLSKLTPEALDNDKQTLIDKVQKETGYDRARATRIVEDEETLKQAYNLVIEQSRTKNEQDIRLAGLEVLSKEYGWFGRQPNFEEGASFIMWTSDFDDFVDRAQLDNDKSALGKLMSIASGFQATLEDNIDKTTVHYFDSDGTKKHKTLRSITELKNIRRDNAEIVPLNELRDDRGNPISMYQLNLGGWADVPVNANVLENGVMKFYDEIQNNLLAFIESPKPTDALFLERMIEQSFSKELPEILSNEKLNDAEKIEKILRIKNEFRTKAMERFLAAKSFNISRP